MRFFRDRGKPLLEPRSRPCRFPGCALLRAPETEIVRCRRWVPSERKNRGRVERRWARRNSLVQAALGRLDKFHEFADVGRAIELSADLFEGLRSVELGAQQQAKRAFDRIEAFAIEAAAFEPDRIHAIAMGLALGDDARKRRHVLRDDGTSADVGVTADAAKLMHGTERTDIRIVLDGHMAR